MVEDSTAAARVVRLLRDRGQTLATAESLTGGLLSGAVTSVPGSSAAYVGGLVTYATELKQRLLDVPAEVIASEGVVSAGCAVAMARGAASGTGADWALATTGVAGPDLQEGKPAGTVFVGLVGPGVETYRRLALDGDRQDVRAGTVVAALDMLGEVLLSANTPGS
jgi:nicotinamide-nucleotide amidase